jgi:hypothetical protein
MAGFWQPGRSVGAHRWRQLAHPAHPAARISLRMIRSSWRRVRGLLRMLRRAKQAFRWVICVGEPHAQVGATVSTEGEIPHAGTAANPPANPSARPPATPPDNLHGRQPDSSPGGTSAGTSGSRKLRHRVDDDVLVVWRAERPEPPPRHTPELHAVEFLRWLSSCFPAGAWVAFSDIQYELYPAFLQERGWFPQPMQGILRHMKTLTDRREWDVSQGPRSTHPRLVETQYRIPAAVVDIEAARKRA